MPPSSFLYEATGVSPGATSVPLHTLTIASASTVNPSLGFFTQNGGIAIDPVADKLYFTLENGSTGGGLYEYNLSDNPTGILTTTRRWSPFGN